LSGEFPVSSFYSKTEIPVDYRGYISFAGGGKSGYRYVDVVGADGLRYRYTMIHVPKAGSKIGWIDAVLKKEKTILPAPRYAVTYEDHVIPEERALGIASSTVKVIDLQTNELLGEFTRYALGGGFEKITAQNSSPWLGAYKCSNAWSGGGSGASTRLFVDQVLIPLYGES
jgi:hypothetical protein